MRKLTPKEIATETATSIFHFEAGWYIRPDLESGLENSPVVLTRYNCKPQTDEIGLIMVWDWKNISIEKAVVRKIPPSSDAEYYNTEIKVATQILKETNS